MGNTIIYWVFLLFFICAAFTVLYLLVLAVAGRWFYRRPASEAPLSSRIALLVPAYKEDSIIVSTAKNHLTLDYPKELFDVYIIADSFQPETIAELKSLPIHVLEVSFEKSTKSKALHQAFHRITKQYDIAMICDADNFLGKQVLRKVNNTFQGGAHAIQARRVAKNLDTPFAILDACSEAINNHFFRKGQNALGYSSSVIGSGMAFEFRLIKDVFDYIHSLGGTITHEDKILQLKVVEQHKIIYLEDALIFDEKVDNRAVFKQQRKRWVSGQFMYLEKDFVPALKQLLKGNVSYFNLAVANNLVLPRAFILALLPLLTIAGFLFSTTWGIAGLALCVLYGLAMFLALPPELLNRNLFQALLRLPRAIAAMFGTLRHGKKANETFIHTVKTKTEVSNTLFNEQGK